MTTETRSSARLPGMLDPADGKAVLTGPLLRDALHVFCPDSDAGAEHGAKVGEQRLLGRGAEVRRTYHVEHNLVDRWLHHLQLFEARYRGERALHQRHAGDQRTVAALEIVGNPPDDPLHERQAASASAAAIRRDPDILNPVADERHAAIDEVRDDDR